MKKRLGAAGALFLLLAIVFTVAACNGNPQEEINPEMKVTDREEQRTPEEPKYPYTAPLTGLGSREEVDDRIIMVMIDNLPPARPQSGLDQADIVYEMLEEGSITRFNAFFQSQKPAVIGPVRSIRPYNIELALGFDAIMVHAGGSTEALTILQKNGYDHLDEIYGSGQYFWRENFRRRPHNLYTDLDKLRQAAKDKGFREASRIPHLKFLAEGAETQGDPANTVRIVYDSRYEVGYEYDRQKGQYKRYTQGEPHTDLTSGEQYAATNVLVIAARHRIIDNQGHRDIDLHGPGDGFLFQKGKAVRIKWQMEDGIIRAYKDGEEAGLYPGNTWVNVIPDAQPLENMVTFQ
ncbi:DUF3048 domain-containing protein [Bacillaceae bacterium]